MKFQLNRFSLHGLPGIFFGVFAIIFIENKQENIVKISLRSKGDFSVNEFSRTHYNGGGHTNAAGGRSLLSLKDTVTQFTSILPNYKDQLRIKTSPTVITKSRKITLLFIRHFVVRTKKAQSCSETARVNGIPDSFRGVV